MRVSKLKREIYILIAEDVYIVHLVTVFGIFSKLKKPTSNYSNRKYKMLQFILLVAKAFSTKRGFKALALLSCNCELYVTERI